MNLDISFPFALSGKIQPSIPTKDDSYFYVSPYTNVSMSVLNSEINVYKQWSIHQNKHNHINIFMWFVIYQFPYSHRQHSTNCSLYAHNHWVSHGIFFLLAFSGWNFRRKPNTIEYSCYITLVNTVHCDQVYFDW